MKNTDPKSVTLSIRLVEDVDSFYWEPLSKRNEQRAEAWHHLTRKFDYLPCSLKTGDMDISEIEARVQRVAKALGFSIHRHPNYKDKFILRHALPLLPTEPEEINGVDLKWSLWSKDQETWVERKQSVTWDKMEVAFLGTSGPVTVYTSPRKEVASGTVTICKGHAKGTFAYGWDEPEDLAQTLNSKCDYAFIECLPGSMYLCGIGVERSFSIRSRTFLHLMEQIDNEEAELQKENRQAWQEIEKIFDTSQK